MFKDFSLMVIPSQYISAMRSISSISYSSLSLKMSWFSITVKRIERVQSVYLVNLWTSKRDTTIFGSYMTDQAKSVKDNWDIVLTDTNETKLMNLQIISYIPLALSVIFCVTHILPRGFLSVFHRLLNDSIDLDAERAFGSGLFLILKPEENIILFPHMFSVAI